MNENLIMKDFDLHGSLEELEIICIHVSLVCFCHH